MKSCIITSALVFYLLLSTFSVKSQENQDNNYTYNKGKAKTTAGSVWKHEIDYPPLTTKSGLRSQIFYLILYIDGTYEQQVFIVPEDKETYKGIRYYELKGKWGSNNQEITLDEYGKQEKIPNDVFYSKFENIDNIVVKK